MLFGESPQEAAERALGEPEGEGREEHKVGVCFELVKCYGQVEVSLAGDS